MSSPVQAPQQQQHGTPAAAASCCLCCCCHLLQPRPPPAWHHQSRLLLLLLLVHLRQLPAALAGLSGCCCCFSAVWPASTWGTGCRHDAAKPQFQARRFRFTPHARHAFRQLAGDFLGRHPAHATFADSHTQQARVYTVSVLTHRPRAQYSQAAAARLRECAASAAATTRLAAACGKPHQQVAACQLHQRDLRPLLQL